MQAQPPPPIPSRDKESVEYGSMLTVRENQRGKEGEKQNKEMKEKEMEESKEEKTPL